MPVSQENEAVLRGKVAPKKPDNEAMEEEKEEGPKKPLRPEDVAVGIDGDVEKQFKMLGFAD